jgi:hypothetical protein
VGGRVVAVVVAGWMATALSGPVAAAAEAEGCTAQAVSFDKSDAVLDTAAAPGEGGTGEDPLDVVWAGPIDWSGTTEEVLQDGTYQVTVTPANGGVILESIVSSLSSSAISGEFANDDAKTEREGTSSLANYSFGVPLVAGTQSVEWSMTAAAGSCTGLGYISITDSPVSTVTWWLALFLIVVGAVGLLFARPTVRRQKG